MDKSKFEKAKNIERRIFQLELLREYFASHLKNEFLSLDIQINVLGYKTNTPVKLAPYSVLSKESFDEQDSDKEYLLSAIQKRIDELKKKFDNL